jgi:hypothetical protein
MNYPIKENIALVDDGAVETYLSELFAYVEWEPHHIIALRPQGEKGTPKEGRPGGDVWLQPGLTGFDAVVETIKKYVRAYAGDHQAAFTIPAVLNRPSGSAEAVGLFTAVVVDIDKGDTGSALAHATNHLGAPTMIVESGGVTDAGSAKLHLYYRLTEPTQDIVSVMKARHMLAVKLGGDRAFGMPKSDRTGLGRAHQPIRIPGSVHAKNGQPKKVGMVKADGPDHELLEFIEKLEAMPPAPGVDAGDDAAGEQLRIGFGQAMGGKFVFGPGAISNPFEREEIGAALSGEIKEGGDGDRNRWTEFSRVAGHYIREARDGIIDLVTAEDLTRGWMNAKMSPPWPEDRFKREFVALYQKDQRAAKNVALAEAQGAVPVVIQADGTRADVGLEAFGEVRWSGREKPKRQFMVEGLIQPGKHHLLVAEGGAGKTFMSLELIAKVAAPREGDAWLGKKIDPAHCGAVVMFTTEDDTDEITIRLHELNVMDRVAEATKAGRFYIVPTIEAGGSFPLVARAKDGTPKLSPRWEYWLTEISRVPNLKLVVIDTANSVMHGEENSATVINEFVQALTVVCGGLGAAVLVLHHVRKAGQEPIRTPEDMLNAIRGSGAISASFRVAIGVWHESEYEKVLKAAGEAVREKALYRFAVVKGNNPELMPGVGYLLRNRVGFLEDATARMVAATKAGGQERAAWVLWAFQFADAQGYPLSPRAVWDRRAALPGPVRSMSKHEFDSVLGDLRAGGKLVEIVGHTGRAKELNGALVGPDSPFLAPMPPERSAGKFRHDPEGWAYDPVTGEVLEG